MVHRCHLIQTKFTSSIMINTKISDKRYRLLSIFKTNGVSSIKK